MTTIPNQKVVTTKGTQHDKNNAYAMINIKAMEIAMLDLKPNTFKLWCYLAKNQNNYTFALSSVDACRFCAISSSSYHRGITELIEAGYLVNTDGNHYDFYEMKPEEKVIEVTIRKNQE